MRRGLHRVVFLASGGICIVVMQPFIWCMLVSNDGGAKSAGAKPLIGHCNRSIAASRGNERQLGNQ